MAWREEHLRASEPWFNPWPIKYLMPVYKWFPLYWPNGTWEIRGTEFPRQRPKPPEGLAVPWWKQPKEHWPHFQWGPPWEEKVFGAWPASQVSMAEDLQSIPPFGYIKAKMPGEPDISGNQIAWIKMKMHMRHVTSVEMQMMTVVDAFGVPKFYLKGEPWDQHQDGHRLLRAAINARRKEKYEQMLQLKLLEPLWVS
jgi:hypothetical protein